MKCWSAKLSPDCLKKSKYFYILVIWEKLATGCRSFFSTTDLRRPELNNAYTQEQLQGTFNLDSHKEKMEIWTWSERISGYICLEIFWGSLE